MTGPEPGTVDAEQVLAQRRATMFATLGFNEVVRVPEGMEATFRALRSWRNSWRGIGDIEAGMRRQGYDLYLCRYDGRGWRATFERSRARIKLYCQRSKGGGLVGQTFASPPELGHTVIR